MNGSVLRWNNWPLALKLASSSVMLIVVVVVAITLLFIRREQAAFRKELAAQAEAILDGLSVIGADSLYKLDVESLSYFAQRTNESPAIKFVRFYDPEGRLVADPEDEGAAFRFEEDPVGRRLVDSTATVFDWYPDHLEAGQPVVIAGQRFGAVSLGLTTAGVKAKVDAVRDQGIVIALVTATIAGIATAAFSRSITVPLSDLVRSAKSIGEGNLNEQIRARGDDEVGKLAHAVSDMVASLESSRLSLDERATELNNANRQLTVEVTERRRAQDGLRETNGTLEATLEELRETQDQIIQQERLRALGTMASGIAHDFNNSLFPIVAFSDLLLRNPERLEDQEKAREFIEVISKSAESASGVVGRLNQFYRARAEDEAFSQLDLNALVLEVVEMTKPRWKDQAQANGGTTAVDTDLRGDETVSGDRSELRNVLTNLIFNAVDAMPDGGTITIRTAREGDRHVVEVSDTGVGMTDEVRRQCLEPFFTTKDLGGTGLGLSMVHGVVQRHKGVLEIESRTGVGTTFKILLPATESSKSEVAESASQDALIAGLRVLVVDDDRIILTAIVESLNEKGHTAVAARSGREALERFSAGEFDAVVIDRAMPDMNGDEVATSIKSVAPDTPIVMATGFGEMMTTAGETPEGVDLILSKPFTAETLAVALGKLVST